MITLLTIVHVITCIFLIGIVLLQHGKGADAGASFGGSSQTVFGTDGPLPLLNKVTTAGAVLFMVTSVALAYNSAHQTTGSVMKDIKPAAPVEKAQPEVTPAPLEGPLPRTSGDSNNNASPSEQAPSTFPGQEEATKEETTH